MKKSQRLNEIIKLIDCCECVADIGTDHGFLIKLLLDSNKAKRVVAIDISPNSLSKAIRFAKTQGLTEKVDFVVADGFDGISKEFNVGVVVAAGIGGNEIIEIIKKCKNLDKFDYFVLQPVQNSLNLKQYLVDIAFELLDDVIIAERNNFYHIIKTRWRGGKYHQKLNWFELKYGKKNLLEPNGTVLNYIIHNKVRLSKKIEYLTESEKQEYIFIDKFLNGKE